MRIFISGNSPGELWGWIRPFVKSLRHRIPEARLTLFLLPCPYATGKEAEMARRFLDLDAVYSPKESLRTIFLGNRSLRLNREKAVLVHLGGDLMYASFLSWRLHVPAYAYQWGNTLWDKSIRRYFVSHESQKTLLGRRKISLNKIQVVGNLMKDAIEQEFSSSHSEDFVKSKKYGVAFFPGSRPVEIKHMLPFYLRVAEIASSRLPEVEFALSRSPFISEQELAEAMRPQENRLLESSSGNLLEKHGEKWIATQGGAEIRVSQSNPYQLMKNSDCLVTIPGTKCGEAGILGCPMLVVVPLNRLEEIPYPGIPGLLEKVPCVGKKLKGLVMKIMLPRLGFVAQPNLLAGREVVPEIVGQLTPGIVAEQLCNLLKDEKKRQAIRQDLLQLYQTVEPAADKIITALLPELQ